MDKQALDIPRIGVLPSGPLDSICDVGEITVGHCTLADGPLQTGVTVVRPHGGDPFLDKTPAAATVLNGFGKMEVCRNRSLLHGFLVLQPAELISTSDPFLGSAVESLLFDDGRIEGIAEVVAIFHQAFCFTVVGFNPGFCRSLGKRHAGEVVLVEFSDFACFFFINDGSAVFNVVSIGCMPHVITSFLSVSDRTLIQSMLPFGSE